MTCPPELRYLSYLEQLRGYNPKQIEPRLVTAISDALIRQSDNVDITRKRIMEVIGKLHSEKIISDDDQEVLIKDLPSVYFYLTGAPLISFTNEEVDRLVCMFRDINRMRVKSDHDFC